MCATRVRTVVSSLWFHVAVLVLGTAFLLVGAFHGNIWFDESYSVAIANHSFSEIWRIGSGDVHPVLFYWALHALNLVFGQNILAYRLFAVAGSVLLAALGLTHVRRDFGWKHGVLFTLFVLFMPYIAVMATEIRMYSWATFSVMLCALTAWRIACSLREGGTECVCRVRARAEGKRRLAGVPVSWWATFFVSSLACAYLHYFGALSAFMVNLLLLIFLVSRACRHRGARALAVFAVGAVAQVALYVPWLAVLAGQLGVVSNTYWANIVFPTTYIEFATYPVLTSFVSFALKGNYGELAQGFFHVMLALTYVWLIVWAAWAIFRLVRRRAARAAAPSAAGSRVAMAGASAEGAADGGVCSSFAAPAAPAVSGLRGLARRALSWLASDAVMPLLCALAIYLGVFLISFGASILMNSLIVYYRYLGVAIGPLLFAASFLLSRVRCRGLVAAACAILIATSIGNMTLVVRDYYSSYNQVPLEEMRDTVECLTEENDGTPPLVISSDIGYISLTSLAYPDIPQTYMDWQKGNWNLAYEAYSPTLTCKNSWEEILDDYHGPIVVLGQAQSGVMPRDVEDLSRKDGFTLVESHSYYRPYERTWLTLAVIERE